MTHFPNFKKTHRPAIKCRKATGESIKQYQGKLPDALLEDWQEAGWCGYGKGLIWIIDPSTLESSLKDWVEESERAIAFARTAFGDIIVWTGKDIYYVDVLYDKYSRIGGDIDVFFDVTLCDKVYINSVLDRKLFLQALKKLGELDHDECYGFEPAISLGGSGTLDTLRKVKLREYLSILAQTK